MTLATPSHNPQEPRRMARAKRTSEVSSIPMPDDPVLSRSSSDLTVELRKVSHTLLRHSTAAAISIASLVLLGLISLLFFDRKLAIFRTSYGYVTHILLTVIMGWSALARILQFDSVNKTGEALFESLSEYLQVQNRLSRRKPRPKSSVTSGTAEPISEPEEIPKDSHFSASNLLLHVALKEYTSARYLPFWSSTSGGSKFYLLLVGLIVIFTMLTPVLARYINHLN